MNIIQMLNSWCIIDRIAKNPISIINGKKFKFPIWSYCDDIGGGDSRFKFEEVFPFSKSVHSELRLFIYAYESNEKLPFWYYISKYGDDWFSWIYRKYKKEESPKIWMERHK